MTDAATILALAADPRVHQNGGWMELVANAKPAPTLGMLVALERAKQRAAKHLRDRQESWERSDTDGFLSQWSSDLSSGLERLRADLLADGGFALFPALYSRHTGERVNAVMREGQYGDYWMLLDDEDRPTGKFYNDARTKRAKLWKAGFVVLGEWQPAKAYMAGRGYGLSGQAWPAVKSVPYDEREGADLTATDEDEAIVAADRLRAEGKITTDDVPERWTTEERESLAKAIG